MGLITTIIGISGAVLWCLNYALLSFGVIDTATYQIAEKGIFGATLFFLAIWVKDKNKSHTQLTDKNNVEG